MWQKIIISGLSIVLLLSIAGNIGLIIWAQHQADLARELRNELHQLRQEREALQQEIDRLRAESQAAIVMAETMETVSTQTEALRGLDPQTPVTRQLVDRTEITQIVSDILLQEYPPADRQRDQIVLSTLGLIPADLELSSFLEALLSEQVAGLYDPAAETLYVVQYGRGMGGLEKMILAHEHTHALQDQHFDLEAMGLAGGETDYNDDQLLAMQALVEGDATLAMQQYIQHHFTSQDLWHLVGVSVMMNQEQLSAAPGYLRRSLTFPYQDGMLFVVRLYGRGGWAAVDAAFANPPQSSEQILHPYLYPDEMPQIVFLPPLTPVLRGDWQLVEENVLGEFGLREYLDVELTNRQATEAAAGWGGDRYAVYQDGVTGQTILTIVLVWDEQAEQTEFGEFYRQYAEKRFGQPPQTMRERPGLWWLSEETVVLMTDETTTETVIIVAPDETTAQQVVAQF